MLASVEKVSTHEVETAMSDSYKNVDLYSEIKKIAGIKSYEGGCKDSICSTGVGVFSQHHIGRSK